MDRLRKIIDADKAAHKFVHKQYQQVYCYHCKQTCGTAACRAKCQRKWGAFGCRKAPHGYNSAANKASSKYGAPKRAVSRLTSHQKYANKKARKHVKEVVGK